MNKRMTKSLSCHWKKNKIKAIKELLEIEDTSDEASSPIKDKEEENPHQNINEEPNNITQFELEDLKENINVIFEEDFPEEVESDEERSNKNNNAKNLKEFFKKIDSKQNLENKYSDEKNFENNIVGEKRTFKRSNEEPPLLLRGKQNTTQTSPDKIIPEKYLIKTEEFTLENNPKKIY